MRSSQRSGVSKSEPDPTNRTLDRHERKKLENELAAPVKKVGYTDKRQEKGNKPKWMTKSMAEDLSREDILKATWLECRIYLVFVICVCIFVMGSQSSYNFYLTQSLSTQFVDKDFRTVLGKSITFRQISSAADLWMYIENHFIPSIFWEYTNDKENMKDENDMNIMYDNRVLGVPRLRQLKVRDDSCRVHKYFRQNFTSCYGTYKPIHADEADFGPGEATAWTYSSAEETKSLSYRGQMATYGGDGFYVDLQRERNGTLKIIQDLIENKWIRRGTRVVFIDVIVYNTNTDLYSVCKFIFEFPPVGGVISNADIYSMKLLRFSKKWDVFVWICELASYVFVTYYLLEEIREIIYFKWRYLMKFWNCVDFAIIVSAITAGAWSLMEFMQVPLTMEELRKSSDRYANVDYLASMFTSKNHLYAMLLFFVFLKAFKYLNFNRSMGQLSSTLKHCAKDIVYFTLMFIIVFSAYSELGYLLFGSAVENFSTIGMAMFTLLRTTLGDFQYDEIERADKVLGPIYFVSFIYLVFFVLLNMFLAIINDTYTDVRTEIATGPDELQMSEYLRDKFYRFLQKIGIKKNLDTAAVKDESNASVEHIREILTKHGFDQLQIEMFFDRYNVNVVAELKLDDADDLIRELDTGVDDDQKGNQSVSQGIGVLHEQQQKLEQLDATISELFEQVKLLLDRIDHMESVEKVKKA